MPNPSILPPLPPERLNPRAQDAFSRMRRAHERGTGCHLTADMIAGLALTTLCEAWYDEEVTEELS